MILRRLVVASSLGLKILARSSLVSFLKSRSDDFSATGLLVTGGGAWAIRCLSKGFSMRSARDLSRAAWFCSLICRVSDLNSWRSGSSRRVPSG